MRILIVLLCVLMSTAASAQKYFTKTGKTEFKASKETIEPIEAVNDNTTVILNTENGTIAALLFVKGLHFKIALMEEHFNENYMESDKFPKATFKGRLENFAVDKLSDTPVAFPLTGNLNIKGKEKSIQTVANVRKNGGIIDISSEFTINIEDFDVRIPNVVKDKIAKDATISLQYELEQKK